jgi:multidrug efflux pump subunit AcrA (membrane-fusion protein)
LKASNLHWLSPLAALTFAPCESAPEETDPRTDIQFVQMTTVQPVRPAERAFTRVVTARVQSNLGFRVPGKVVERLVNTGDFVKQGKPLMRIDSTDLALAIAAQAAAVASARALTCGADQRG